MDTKPRPPQRTEPRRIRLLNVFFDTLDLDALLGVFAGAILEGRRIVVGHHNLHSIYLCQKSDRMPLFYDKADYVHADGMSLIVLCRLLGHRVPRSCRQTSLDWLIPAFAHCRDRAGGALRVFLLGGRPGVAEAAAAVFRQEVPGLEIRHCCGYFDMHDPVENGEVVALINDFAPHLLLVGMGMPRQEEWVLQNAERVEANVVCSLGAFMDYYAGVIPVPPRWMGRIGLEWLFRLVSEPRRLGSRYLLEPWLVLWLLLKHFRAGVRG